MAIKVGCFALINPFQTLDKQVDQIKDWGFEYADVTDNADGACLGSHFGFNAVASLDANAFDIKRLFESRGVKITSVCAHANLLDPSAPWRYGTSQIIKAIRMAAAIGVKHVITTEGDAHTAFGQNLTDAEAIFSIKEKLNEPLQMAKDYGVKILLEPHGKYTDSVAHMEKILHECDSEALGVNLDTGNLWLGGGSPVEMIQKLGSKIEHIHWKDLPAEFQGQRGKIFGCGMSLIALGDGIVGIESIYEELMKIGFDGYTTLEIAGEDAVKKSFDYLNKLDALYAQQKE
ncbi:sugar phosphate isomerase/epimerase family protein [Zobellia uliginosa]|uniref:sugar phosphate isomerase/epimerase family protein n=1 Tax=Zobellia uliginosa TaxID=143224 RepID=UPI0026E392F7|nr:sugar phosphate isomerase/epimerase family protein [Zobellia uliginosa]MDO6519557.1 sugar phosphate isomerase/epimerase family protein [Zobellia uliginosa]